MFAAKTLARRLLKAMFPWYLLLALSLTATSSPSSISASAVRLQPIWRR